MDRPASTDVTEEAAPVTESGEVTIPEQIREALDLDAPGRLLFRETDDGTVVVERVPGPAEMRGFAARSEASTDEATTELLRAKRRRDREQRTTHARDR